MSPVPRQRIRESVDSARSMDRPAHGIDGPGGGARPSGPEDDYEVRGQYHDRWLKTEEGWRISYRKFLTMAATPPRPDAPGIGRIS